MGYVITAFVVIEGFFLDSHIRKGEYASASNSIVFILIYGGLYFSIKMNELIDELKKQK